MLRNLIFSSGWQGSLFALQGFSLHRDVSYNFPFCRCKSSWYLHEGISEISPTFTSRSANNETSLHVGHSSFCLIIYLYLTRVRLTYLGIWARLRNCTKLFWSEQQDSLVLNLFLFSSELWNSLKLPPPFLIVLTWPHRQNFELLAESRNSFT